MKARAEAIQDRTAALLSQAEDAVLDLIAAIEAAQKAGAGEEQLAAARDFHRKAFWRLDYISAENSMGFHAPQESARILAEAIDLARQGQVNILETVRAKE
jgi:nitrite reductase (cytochrome c-552)